MKRRRAGHSGLVSVGYAEPLGGRFMRLLLLLAAAAVAGCGAKTGFEDEGAPAPARSITPTPTGSPTASGPRPIPTSTPTPGPNPVPTPNPNPQSCTNVTGLWAGTWTARSGVSGTWQTNMVESGGGALSGKSVVTGTPACGSASTIVGKRDGCTITFGLADFNSCTVDFVGTLSDGVMFGTFTVTAGVSDQGDWRGSRQ